MILQVGVKIFLQNKEGKYLLVKRNPAKYGTTSGSWDIVGGRIDVGSKLLENLKREVFEETKLDIEGEPILINAQDIINTDNGLHVVRLSYQGKTSGEPILDKIENTEYLWLGLDEMKEMGDLDLFVKEIINKGLIEYC